MDKVHLTPATLARQAPPKALKNRTVETEVNPEDTIGQSTEAPSQEPDRRTFMDRVRGAAGTIGRGIVRVTESLATGIATNLVWAFVGASLLGPLGAAIGAVPLL